MWVSLGAEVPPYDKCNKKVSVARVMGFYPNSISKVFYKNYWS